MIALTFRVAAAYQPHSLSLLHNDQVLSGQAAVAEGDLPCSAVGYPGACCSRQGDTAAAESDVVRSSLTSRCYRSGSA